MSTEWDIPKNKFASGLLCGAVASGVVAAASLGGVGTANATCVSFSGFSLGTGCTSSLGPQAGVDVDFRVVAHQAAKARNAQRCAILRKAGAADSRACGRRP